MVRWVTKKIAPLYNFSLPFKNTCEKGMHVFQVTKPLVHFRPKAFQFEVYYKTSVLKTDTLKFYA